MKDDGQYVLVPLSTVPQVGGFYLGQRVTVSRITTVPDPALLSLVGQSGVIRDVLPQSGVLGVALDGSSDLPVYLLPGELFDPLLTPEPDRERWYVNDTSSEAGGSPEDAAQRWYETGDWLGDDPPESVEVFRAQPITHASLVRHVLSGLGERIGEHISEMGGDWAEDMAQAAEKADGELTDLLTPVVAAWLRRVGGEIRFWQADGKPVVVRRETLIDSGTGGQG